MVFQLFKVTLIDFSILRGLLNGFFSSVVCGWVKNKLKSYLKRCVLGIIRRRNIIYSNMTISMRVVFEARRTQTMPNGFVTLVYWLCKAINIYEFVFERVMKTTGLCIKKRMKQNIEIVNCNYVGWWHYYVFNTADNAIPYWFWFIFIFTAKSMTSVDFAELTIRSIYILC